MTAPEGWKWELVPDYPVGDVVGPCICGSWPGGHCLKCPPISAPRTGYTTVDPSEGEQAKPCYPDPVMGAVRRCAEIALEWRYPQINTAETIASAIRREFGLLPTSET